MRLISGFRFVSLVAIVFAMEQAQSCPNDGQPVDSAQDVIQCILKNHPELKRAQLNLKQSEYLEGVARQIPNPELATKAVSGRVSGENQVTTETSLVQTFELGGKRSARIEKAQASKSVIEADLTKSQEDIIIGTILDLYRLRQLIAEKDILDESLTTYSKILRQIKQRPKLTPDQEVSKEIFQFAEADYKLKISVASSDISSIRKIIEINIGGTLPQDESFLPATKSKWPVLAEASNEIKSSEFQKSLAENKLAKAEFETAKSESWPDLKLGPDVETDSSGGSSDQKWGLTLSLPLPIFHLNGAGRSYAKYGLEASELKLEYTKNLVRNQRDIQLTKYKTQVEALTVSQPLLENALKKKKNIESLYNRGLISSSQLIESQRQLLEYTKSRNDTELNTIEALWKIYAIDGRLLEEKL